MSFHFKQFNILHQTEGLKVNTDGCLLGALSDFNYPANCLDIGTGTGVIALMLAQKFPEAKIKAIELNEIAFKQALLNINASPFFQKINLIHADIADYTPEIKFDLIVCNPPYFTNHLQGPDKIKNMALHNDALPQHILIEKVVELLSEEGLFMVIYPPKEMQLLEAIALKNNLYKTISFRIENKAGNHYRNIAGFSKNNKAIQESIILTNDTEGKRTEQFSKIMQDFYL